MGKMMLTMVNVLEELFIYSIVYSVKFTVAIILLRETLKLLWSALQSETDVSARHSVTCL